MIPKLHQWFLATVLLVASTFPVYGSPENDRREQTPDDAQLREIQTLLIREQTLSGSFIQTKILHNFHFPIESSGNFSIDEQNNLSWNLIHPIKSSITISDTGMIFSEQGLTTNKKPTPQNIRPEFNTATKMIRSVLSMDWPVLKQQFDIRVEKPTPDWMLTLTPKSELVSVSISHIELSGHHSLNRVVIFETQEDKTIINFVANTLPL